MFKITVAVTALLSAFIASSCRTVSTVEKSVADKFSSDRPQSHALTQAYAQWRAEHVSDVQYELTVSLSETDKDYPGQVKIRFNYKAGSPLTVDFAEGKIETLDINGKRVSSPAYNGNFLVLPARFLVDGANEADITFTHPYSTTGSGLYRFKDPEDGAVYTYTDFEPYDANQFFPCFDQPDLKATYTITADAPAAWTVVSAAQETQRVPSDPGRMRWSFPKTLPFSTYLISLHAGPYKVWTSQAGSIPLRLFAREAMAKYIPADEWFTVTKQGLEFYQKYFDRPYPFGKFDQLLVPNYNHGAMENVGSVTFTERYIRRGKMTDEEREGTAGVILHEMAHQWFGDLATMKWWNDLWLNESFATFMATTALHEATEFKRSWINFTHMKEWAYWEDQLVTTHPISAVVPDTDQAFANFDGISYGKGASVLKQLNFYVTPDAFQKGIDRYIADHAFKNATLADFIQSVQQGAKTDLSNWPKQWLETAGVNFVDTKWTCGKNGKIDSFAVTQSAPPEYPTLRDHRARFALVGGRKSLTVQKTADVTYNGPATVDAFIGAKCPKLVYANFDDYDYVRPILDDVSVKTAETQINDIKDPALRGQVWLSLWDLVRQDKLPVQKFADLVLANLAREKEYKILDSVLSLVGGTSASSSIIYYLPPDDDKLRKDYVSKFEAWIYQNLKAAKAGTDAQKRWFDAYVRVAESPAAAENLVGFLDGRIVLPGFEIDQDRRWSLIIHVNWLDPEEGKQLVSKESQLDKSNNALLMAISAESVRPDPRVKADWTSKLLAGSAVPFAHKRAAASTMFPMKQEDLRKAFSETYFKNLPVVAESKESLLQALFASLAPVRCTPETVSQFGDYLKTNPKLPAPMLKQIKIAHQEDERCVHIRELARKSL